MRYSIVDMETDNIKKGGGIIRRAIWICDDCFEKDYPNSEVLTLGRLNSGYCESCLAYCKPGQLHYLYQTKPIVYSNKLLFDKLTEINTIKCSYCNGDPIVCSLLSSKYLVVPEITRLACEDHLGELTKEEEKYSKVHRDNTWYSLAKDTFDKGNELDGLKQALSSLPTRCFKCKELGYNVPATRRLELQNTLGDYIYCCDRHLPGKTIDENKQYMEAELHCAKIIRLADERYMELSIERGKNSEYIGIAPLID